jgi:hypothetical protein
MTWQFAKGQWATSDGRLETSAHMSTAVASVPFADYTYTVDMQTTKKSGSDVGNVTRAVFRYQDANDYYAVVPQTNGVLALAKMQGGQWLSQLAYANAGLDPTTDHTYKVSADGAHIRVWADGKQYLDYTDPSAIKQGGVGASNQGASGAIANVSVANDD